MNNCHVLYNLLDFPGGTRGKELPANAGDLRDVGSIPGLGRSPGEGNATHSSILALGNPVDRGAWQATFQGVTRESETT